MAEGHEVTETLDLLTARRSEDPGVQDRWTAFAGPGGEDLFERLISALEHRDQAVQVRAAEYLAWLFGGSAPKGISGRTLIQRCERAREALTRAHGRSEAPLRSWLGAALLNLSGTEQMARILLGLEQRY